MTIEEMHIAVNLGVQKIASFQSDSLLPEEIDYELNTAVRRFISQRYNSKGNKYQRGFEQSQKRLDDLRHLVEDYTGYTSSYMGIGYTSTTNGNINIYRYKFPTDYMFLINVLSEVTSTCRKEVGPIKEEIFYRQSLRVPLSPPIAGYAIQEIFAADYTGTPTSLIAGQGGLSFDDLLSDIYNGDVTPSLSSNDSYTDRYFETASADSPTADANEFYLTKDYSSSLEAKGGFFPIDSATIAEGDTNFEDAAGVNGAYMVIRWVNSGNSEETVETVINSGPLVSSIVYRYFAGVDAILPSDNINANDLRILRTNCKFVQQDDVYAVLDDPFNSTKEDGMLYTIQETFVDLYTTDKFIPNSIQLKYLRRPRAIDKLKGIGCELPEHTHHEIVEMAVKSILEGFESPRYNTQSGEVLDSE